MKNLLVPATALLFLAACAPYETVNIHYLKRAGGVPESRYDQTTDIYVLLDGSSLPDAMTSSNSSFISDHSVSSKEVTRYFDSVYFGQELSYEIGETKGHVAAYRVAKSTDIAADPYVKQLHPLTVLTIRLHSYSFDYHKNDPVVETVVDKKTGEEKKIVHDPIWDLSADMKADIELSSYPNRTKIICETVSAGATSSVAVSDDQLADDKVYALNTSLINNLAYTIAYKVRPVQRVYAARPIFPELDEVNDASGPYKTAIRGSWTQAADMWNARLEKDPKNWHAALGLAISHEIRDEYPQAKEYYAMARDLSAGTTETKHINFNDIIAEIPSSPTFKPAVHPSDAWYKTRVAVLPFSDEVVSIDGPDFIRYELVRQLAVSGYNVIHPDDVDSILKDKGFSDGAQLVAVPNEKIAEWLKADLLVFGHIDKFEDQNVGLYQKHEVGGEIKIWDAHKKEFVFDCARDIVNKRTNDDLGRAFLWGLASSWLGRVAKHPLDGEVYGYVKYTLQEWPLKYGE